MGLRTIRSGVGTACVSERGSTPANWPDTVTGRGSAADVQESIRGSSALVRHRSLCRWLPRRRATSWMSRQGNSGGPLAASSRRLRTHVRRIHPSPDAMKKQAATTLTTAPGATSGLSQPSTASGSSSATTCQLAIAGTILGRSAVISICTSPDASVRAASKPAAYRPDGFVSRRAVGLRRRRHRTPRSTPPRAAASVGCARSRCSMTRHADL